MKTKKLIMLVIIVMTFISNYVQAQKQDTLSLAKLELAIQSTKNMVAKWQDTLLKDPNVSFARAEQVEILSLFSDFLSLDVSILEELQKEKKENKELKQQLEIARLKLEIANMKLKQQKIKKL